MPLESESVRQNNPTPNAQGKASKQSSHPEIPIPPTPTPKSECQPPKHHCEITCKTEKNWWDKTKPFVETAGILLLAVYTLYTIKMYCANKQAAEAATKSATVAKEALVAGNRSWIEIQSSDELGTIEIPRSEFLAQLKELSFELGFTNIGNIPARKIKIASAIEVLPRDQETHFAYRNGIDITRNVLFPHRTSKFHTMLVENANATTFLTAEVTELLRKELANGEKYIVIYANAEFEDSFGRHWSRYCTWVSFKKGPYNSRNCIDYNDIGDYPDK